MRSLRPLLAALLLALPLPAAAQYNTRENIQINCYGGRNQMGLHVCTCDQGHMSGLAALILGNSVHLYGPGTMANCLAWADEMNGVQDRSGRTPPPDTPDDRADDPGDPGTPDDGDRRQSGDDGIAIPPPLKQTDRCSKAFNSCVTEGNAPQVCAQVFNACNDLRIVKQLEERKDEGIFRDYIGAGGAQVPSQKISSVLFSGEWVEVVLDCGAVGAAIGADGETCPGVGSFRWTGKGWSICTDDGSDCRSAPPLRIGAGFADLARIPLVPLFPGRYVALSPDGNLRYNGRVIGSYLTALNRGDLSKTPPPCPPDRWGADCECPPRDGSFSFYCAATSPNVRNSNESGAPPETGSQETSDTPPAEDGHAATLPPSDKGAEKALAQRMRSEVFHIKFDCAQQEVIGAFYCDRSYYVEYRGGGWHVCGPNRKPWQGGDPLCATRDDPSGPSLPQMSAWGMHLVVQPDGSLTHAGSHYGWTDLKGPLP